ncbi:MAG: hypothetical protein Roseis2KO_59460 [Roseivirga sp.]
MAQMADFDISSEIESQEFDELDQHEQNMAEELLDNLGYLQFYDADSNQPSSATVLGAINQFRDELRSSILPDAPLAGELPFLTEEEEDLLGNLSSLEGHFELHRFELSQIEADALLTRVLNFRLMALSLHTKHNEHRYDAKTTEALQELKQWTGLDSDAELIEKLGDIAELIQLLNSKDTFEGSSYHGIAFFENSRDTAVERQFRNDGPAFRTGLAPLTAYAREEIMPILDKRFDVGTFPARYKRRVEAYEEDRINKLFLRIIQLQLWLKGTYDGRLDEDMGTMSLNAIYHLAEVVNFEEPTPIIYPETFVMKLNRNHWAINVRQFLSLVAMNIDVAMRDKEVKSVSAEVEKMSEGLTADEKENFYRELDGLVKADQGVAPNGKKKKRKSKNGRSFWRLVGGFFKKIGKVIVKGFQAVINALKSFFKWIKNGVKALVNEIKKAFSTLQNAVGFVFGKRQITTGGITSDYDFDFDVVTRVSGPLTPEMIQKHELKNQSVMTDLRKVMDFLEKALPVVIKFLTPPVGWIKAGIKLVGLLLKNVFNIPALG